MDADLEPMTSSAALAAPPAGAAAVRSTRAIVAVAVGLAVLYGATATWQAPYNVDAFTNAVQARSFAADGSPILEEATGLTEPRYQGAVAWFVDATGGPTSQYPPGAAAWGSLFYLADTSTSTETVTWTNDRTGESGTVELTIPSFAPAAVASAVAVALAMLFLGLTLAPLIGERRAALSMAIAGLGTGAWSVAADKLWQHGPAMMCISLGTWLASRNRFLGSGVAFAAALLVRPHTALVAAALGITVSITRRSIRPALHLGAASAVGLVGLLAYNHRVFGRLTLSGGYGSGFGDQVTDSPPLLWLARVAAAFLDPSVGMLWTSSFLAVALLGLTSVRRTAPDWAIGAAIGGALYLLVQLKANRVSGGTGFFSYRYPLETLMAAAPLLTLATISWTSADARRRGLLTLLTGASVAFHAYGAVLA